ncbi:NUDIX domain-containing protein [Leifsonia poae]|uniref:NUDIX domain-containing protein n=1 Tax=Leifsonia poae TaxID=110933 RepID=UPI001CBC5F67|nr:NUDIX domain-containing protein [Leifsonia poae]
MPAVRSAGLLLYRRTPALEVWIAHMGGPFWERKDDGAWSIPKGLIEDTEDEFAAARREFGEEVGTPAPEADYRLLGEFRLSSGKSLTVFAAEAAFDPPDVRSNTFSLEWPPHSGAVQDFPEIDDARWFPLDQARSKLTKGQRPLLDALAEQQRRTDQ